MKVLSLFDGMSCGQLALKRAGIKVEQYYASEIDDNAIKVTQHNFPNTIQLGDVCSLDINQFSEIDLLIGGSPCFVKGTRVITSEGYKNIEEIKVGDEVLTHKNRYRKVLAVGGKYSDVCKIKAQGIIETTTTENHPYYIRNKNKKGLSEPIWKEVKEIKKGDYLGIPIIKKEENPYNLSEEQCWLLGRYVADGHIRKEKRKERKNSYHYQVIYSVGATKVEDFKNKVKDQHFSCYAHSKSVYRCVVSSKWLTEFIIKNNFGIGAENKNIPSVILNLPIELAQKFIEGYLSGDGNKRKENKYRFTTVSYKLVIGMSLLCAKVYKTLNGISLIETQPTKVIEGRVVNQKPYYQSDINFIKPTKTLYKVEDEYIWTPIKEVRKTKMVEKVYNIEVEEDNSYTANNAIVHNCQGFSIAGNKLNFEDERSKLFFEYVRIKNELNPKYFLFENVKMKDEIADIIDEMLGVKRVYIDSRDFTGHIRKRYYWTNIPIDTWEKKDIKIKDIIDNNIPFDKDMKFFLDRTVYNPSASYDGIITINPRDNKGKQTWQRGRVYDIKGNCPTICASLFDLNITKDHKTYRKLTIEECERLQGVPIGYTSCVKKNEAGKLLGNGWTVDVIAHILKGLK